MDRSKREQANHDKKVREEANKLKEKGFKVNADIKGFSKPPSIGGYRPDIVATKNDQRKIIEIETEESKNTARDKGQQSAFRKEANQNDNTTFRRVITDD